MTLKELSQLYHLNREIEDDKRRLQRLRDRVNSCSSSMTGMPGGGAYDNRMERDIAEIVDIEAIISAKTTQCLHECSRLERYIAAIPDSQTRRIFTMRFVSGLSWTRISISIGGGNTPDGIRKKVYRFLKKEA